MSSHKQITTEVFKGKKLPEFLATNRFFTTPHKYSKVFKSIGLANFKQETNISKAVVDVKKQGGYVWNLLLELSRESGRAKDALELLSSKANFLLPKEQRIAMKEKSNERAQIIHTLSEIQIMCEPVSGKPFHLTNGVIDSENGKIILRLGYDIVNSAGEKIHKKGGLIFKLYKKLIDQCIEHGVSENSLIKLDAMNSYKIFCSENIADKKYQIVFSSDGPEGAWDIATMSMRGGDWKSCQRWTGEYPKCLIGSILSKFVGIIYLTSGAKAEVPAEEAAYRDYICSNSTKMAWRSIVRYAYDLENKTPCLILDKMYPNKNIEAFRAFQDALHKRSNLPVYYGPELSLKTRNIYIPNDDLNKKIDYREKSYQDTPLRTKNELDIFVLENNRIESSKAVQRIQNQLIGYIACELEDAVHQHTNAPEDVKKLARIISLIGSYSSSAEEISRHIFMFVMPPSINECCSVKTFNKKCLKQIFRNRKSILINAKPSIVSYIANNFNLKINNIDFEKYLLDLLTKFLKKEIFKN